MNNFSDKEYQNLRSDTAEIRSCITRYIGYIISVTGFSGVLKYFYEGKATPLGSLLILSISIVIVTMLFEIIWYKFKSHNRFVGYMQLLMHEIDAIPIKVKKKKFVSDEDLDVKLYIKNYQEYLDKKKKKGIKDFYSWEFVMSRLNGSYFSGKQEKTREQAILQSVRKSQFVFSVSKDLYPFIEINNHDTNFFEKIMFPLYLRASSKGFFRNIHLYFTFLFSSESTIILNDLSIENRYVVNGWKYPKKITQIGFISISITYFYFLYSFFSKFRFIGTENLSTFNFEPINILIFILLLGTSAFASFWVYKYVRNLKDLVYGQNSIDYYCWMFFIYRTQMLNNKGVIPVIFSRAFIRYFKNNLYLKIFEENKSTLIDTWTKWGYAKEIEGYKSALKCFKDFNRKQRDMHKVLVNSFKESRPILRENPKKLKIDMDIINKKAKKILSN